MDIIQVEDSAAQRDAQTQSKVMVKRPIAKRAGRSVSECSIPIAQPQAVQVLPNVRKQQSEVQPYSEIQNTNGKVGAGMCA